MGLRLSSFPNAGLLDGTELVGLVQGGETVKAQVNDIAIIAKGPPGSAGEGYPTRIALSDVIATDRDDAYLAEPGREGKFVFSTANLSAQVIADPQQGIYIAPASDPTGASGAWRRHPGIDTWVNAKWFGTKADGVTDDHIALQAWLDIGGSIYLPDGDYFSSAKLIVRKHVNGGGAGYGFDARLVDGSATVGYQNQPGARIHFPAGVDGLEIQPQTTVTDVATAVAASTAGDTQEGAMHSRIANLALVGAGTGATATGVYSRTRVDLENVHAYKFMGKGFDISASSDVPDGNSEFGTASHSTLRGCRAVSNGSHGFHIRGRDTNVTLFESCFSQLNAGWGFLDESELGNGYIACLAATNTLGSFKGTSLVGVQAYFLCYVETGTGYNCDLNSACQVVGGYLAECALTNNAAAIPAQVFASAKTRLNQLNLKQAWGNLGAISGDAWIYRHADQGLVHHGAANPGGTYSHTFRDQNDVPVLQIHTSAKISYYYGPININGNQVLTDRQAAIPNDASGLANEGTVNAILGVLRTHGLITT